MQSLIFKFRFELLALLLIGVLFGSAIIPPAVFENVVMPVCFIFLTVIAIILVKDQNNSVRYLYSWLAIISLILFLIRILNNQQREVQVSFLLIFILFFSLVSYEVFRQMIREKNINHSIIIAAFDCYLLLGLMGALLFTLIFAYDPNAFLNIEPDRYIFDRMLYFSFITLTSIGYGDISPLSPIAEKFTALFGLIGHFYSVVIVGIIVAKYVSRDGSPTIEKP